MKKFYITPKTNTPALKISKLVITLTLLLVSSFFQITRANTWDGNVSSAWENPSNWSSGIVPDATTDATIPTTPLGARFPIITFGAQGVNILIIQSGAVLTMTGGTLEVAQDWANNGSFDATGGTVMFTGGATVISDFSSGANNFYNLTVENAVDPLFNQYLGSMIYIAGDFVNNNASLPAQDIRSTFIFNGSIDQYFYSVSSDIICGTFTVNKTGGKVFLNSHLYTTDFTMTSGDLATSNFNLTIAGNWLNNGGNFLGGTSMVTFTGSGKVIDGSNSTFFPSITLQDGASYTMYNNNSCSDLSFATTNTSTTLTMAVTNPTFMVNGDVTLYQPVANGGTTIWNINAGTVTVTGLINLEGTNVNARTTRLVISEGTLNADGGIMLNGTTASNKILEITGAGIINLRGDLTPADATFYSGSAGTFNYAGNAAQTIYFFTAGAYNNILINNTHPNGVTISGSPIMPSNVTGHLLVQSGTLVNGGYDITLAPSKNFTVSNGANFYLSGISSMVNVSGGGIKTFGVTSTTNYLGMVQSVSAETYGNLGLSGGSVKNMPAAAMVVAGNFSVTGFNTSATAQQSMNILGNVTIGNNATFSAGMFTHNVGRNWQKSGTFNANGSTIVFNGTLAQTIIGMTTFNSVTMNNAFGLTLNSPITVNGVLNLSSGLIFSNPSNVLTISASGSAIGATDNSFVNGPVTKTGNTSFVFPIGKVGTGCQAIAISAPTFPTDEFTAEYIRANPYTLGVTLEPGLTKVSACEYWNLDKTLGSSTVNVSLYGNANSGCNSATGANYFTGNGGLLSDLRVCHFNTSTLTWENDGGSTVGISPDIITTSGPVTLFSPFTFGTVGAAPLPVKLTAFTVKQEDRNALLKWTTASELNNDHFDIERSVDGINFIKIGNVKGKGTTSVNSNYSFIDAHLTELNTTKVYYRLKQVDFNGVFEYGNILNLNLNLNLAIVTSVAPNPFHGVLNVNYVLPESGTATISIIDALGRTLASEEMNAGKGMNTTKFNTQQFSKGLYFVRINYNGEANDFKLAIKE